MIKIYNTHIEICPYKMGDLPLLEDKLSTIDQISGLMIPWAYTLYKDILYIPKGINIESYNKNDKVEFVNSSDEYKTFKPIESKLLPRDDAQKQAIQFIIYGRNTQIGVLALPGFGKTFVTIYAISKLGIRSLIITPNDNIKLQWIKTLLTNFYYEEEDIIDIKGSYILKKIYNNEITGKIYVCNHQTLNSYFRDTSPETFAELIRKMKIGIKVIDEAHIQFKNTLFIDFFTNTYKTIYLTATFDRSDKIESRIFKLVMSKVSTYENHDKSILSNSKHMQYYPIMYQSGATVKDSYQFRSRAGYGIDIIRYSKWLFKQDIIYQLIYSIIDKLIQQDGRVLITVSIIDLAILLKELLCKRYYDKIVGDVHSRNSKSDNDFAFENADIIVTTIKSCGTGKDIKNLRFLIGVEPYASKVIAEQFSGRLRPYFNNDGKQLDTMYFDLVDTSVLILHNYYRARSKILIPKSKKYTIINWNNL